MVEHKHNADDAPTANPVTALGAALEAIETESERRELLGAATSSLDAAVSQLATKALVRGLRKDDGPEDYTERELRAMGEITDNYTFLADVGGEVPRWEAGA